MKPLFMRSWLLVAFITMLAISPANAVSLADLVNNNGTITSGDKVFSNFSYTSASGGLPQPSAISVTSVMRNGNPGLEFQAAWNNPTPGTTLDGLIEYVVTAPSPIYPPRH